MIYGKHEDMKTQEKVLERQHVLKGQAGFLIHVDFFLRQGLQEQSFALVQRSLGSFPYRHDNQAHWFEILLTQDLLQDLHLKLHLLIPDCGRAGPVHHQKDRQAIHPVLLLQLEKTIQSMLHCGSERKLGHSTFEQFFHSIQGLQPPFAGVFHLRMVQQRFMTFQLASVHLRGGNVILQFLPQQLKFHCFELSGFNFRLCLPDQCKVCAGDLFLVELTKTFPEGLDGYLTKTKQDWRQKKRNKDLI